MKLKLLLSSFLFFIASTAFAQQSILRIPRDNQNTPIYGALGLPTLCDAVPVTLATYDVGARCLLPVGGQDTNRQFRAIMLSNSGARTLYVCLGGSAGCTTDHLKLRPGFQIVHDYAYFGQGNNITHVWLRLDAPGTETFDVMIW